MPKLYGLIFTFLALLLYASPAQAGKLLFWRFESANNRLVFNTDSRVQPTAQLIPDPTRVVIDLPGITLGRPTVNQSIGGKVTGIRVAQFDSYTTRLVIQLAPGYTVDPQQVKVRGISPTQWTVDLPTPQFVSQPINSPPPPSTGSPQSRFPAPRSSQGNRNFQVTQNGFFIRTERNGSSGEIAPKRSEDGKTMTLSLPGAVFPNDLNGQTLAVNQYGVGDITFSQASGNPQITLAIAPDSPDWEASYSRLGGLVLFPRGGIRGTQSLTAPPSTGTPLSTLSPKNSSNSISRFSGATINSLDLINNNRQLIIQADRPVRARGNWNRLSGTYEIRIENAQLSEGLKGPQLDRSSPIYQLRIRQEQGNIVIIEAKPATGTRFGQFSQPRSDLLSLEVNSAFYPSSRNPISSYPNSTYPRPSYPNTPNSGASSNIPINIPPPTNPYPSDSYPTDRPRIRGQRLVFIDPGHGGKDPGAIGRGGIQEKDIILPISQYVAQYLQQQGIQTMMARTGDYFVSLQGRTNMANRAGADLFVSIHANSMGAGRPDINGLEVYYFGDRGLADTIHRSILRTVNIQDRRVRKARFYVLRNSRMPSTLVEVGFVTGYDDSAKLTNPSYQQQMAQAIARGIVEYMQQNRL
jgi:N-acetylmuramoyl-L-alanine amidase